MAFTWRYSMRSSKCKFPQQLNLEKANIKQGLEEADLLLLRRCLHQLQLPRYRPLQGLQDQNLDVSNQPCLFRQPESWSPGPKRCWTRRRWQSQTGRSQTAATAATGSVQQSTWLRSKSIWIRWQRQRLALFLSATIRSLWILIFWGSSTYCFRRIWHATDRPLCRFRTRISWHGKPLLISTWPGP